CTTAVLRSCIAVRQTIEQRAYRHSQRSSQALWNGIDSRPIVKPCIAIIAAKEFVPSVSAEGYSDMSSRKLGQVESRHCRRVCEGLVVKTYEPINEISIDWSYNKLIVICAVPLSNQSRIR